MAVKKVIVDLRLYFQDKIARLSEEITNLHRRAEEEQQITFDAWSGDDETGDLQPAILSPQAPELRLAAWSDDDWIAQRSASCSSETANERTRANENKAVEELTKKAEGFNRVVDDANLWERSTAEPLPLGAYSGDGNLAYDIDLILEYTLGSDFDDKYSEAYLFQNAVYVVRGCHTREQEMLLIQEAFDIERRKFERLKHRFDGSKADDNQAARMPIPESVRIAV